MAEQIRTTISAVYWTDTTEESEAIADAVTAALPEVDQGATLVTIEFKPDGRPVTTVPES
jgi:hypothetical protein